MSDELKGDLSHRTFKGETKREMEDLEREDRKMTCDYMRKKLEETRKRNLDWAELEERYRGLLSRVQILENELEASRGIIIASCELERLLAKDLGMDKPELTQLRCAIAAFARAMKKKEQP